MKITAVIAIAFGFLAIVPGRKTLKDNPTVHAWWKPVGETKPHRCVEIYLENNAQMTENQIVEAVQKAADDRCYALGPDVCPKEKAQFTEKGVYRGVTPGPCFISSAK